MITLVFDTETTGLPSKSLPADHPQQARIMQIAMLLLEDGKEVASFYTRLLPDSWGDVHPKALEAHGLSVDSCRQLGVPQALALLAFDQFVQIADRVVAHNLKFDSQLIDIESGLAGVGTVYDWTHSKFACTMEILTPLMQLKRKNGGIKWPNLTEALDWCVPGATIEKAHDALGDVRATAKVWTHIMMNNLAVNR